MLVFTIVLFVLMFFGVFAFVVFAKHKPYEYRVVKENRWHYREEGGRRKKYTSYFIQRRRKDSHGWRTMGTEHTLPGCTSEWKRDDYRTLEDAMNQIREWTIPKTPTKREQIGGIVHEN